MSWAMAAACLVFVACGDDESSGAEKCPKGFVVNQTQECSCGDAGKGTQACQPDGNLSDCSCEGGGTAGTGTAGTTGGTAGSGNPTAGTSGGTAGTGTDDDAGTSNAGTGGGDKDGSVPGGNDKPASDGTQLSSCDPTADMPCDGNLTCYTANATSVGYCTATCETDDDCMDLAGGTFTCSSPAGVGGTQSCRISCDGADDTSCPEFMSCTQVQGGFRCLYDEKDIGSGTAKRYEKCATDGDCSGDLVCYSATGGIGLPGGQTYSGYCTSACEGTDECTEAPATGTAELACGSGGECRLSCSMGGGSAATCPDGMACINLGGGTSRCLYEESGGGI